MIQPSTFREAWWLPGAHLQTLLGRFLHPRPHVPTRAERLELPDGDFLDLRWLDGESPGLTLLLHGLEGSLDSHYIRGLLAALRERGRRAVLIHFRGCSGEPNRLPRSYHSGDTADLDYVVRQIREREGETPLDGVGFSLGGNVLLKWLGEKGENAPLQKAVAVSVPYRLDEAAVRMSRGFSRIYQWYLVGELKRNLLRKSRIMEMPASLRMERAVRAKTFYEFDDAVTAPLHGFAHAEEYYRKSSSRQYLSSIRTSTLLIHARNDPFMTPQTPPAEEELSSRVTLELAERGGHVGFVEGSIPLRPRYYLERRILEFLGHTP